ncbi:hypothetical protein WA026_007824 [Henosepilachna vigintioctopunctata]|uniref:Uncharacterized protein n=1 Tax=Henosepilachna vigintioctopunctata TaxID=420089 RepID=A0AAW1U3C7_9CUCU
MASIKVLTTGIFLIVFAMDVPASALSSPSALFSNVEKIGYSSSKKIRFQLENKNCGCGKAQFGTQKNEDTLRLNETMSIPQEIYDYDYNDEYSFIHGTISFATAEIVGGDITEVCIEVKDADLNVFYSVGAEQKVQLTVIAYGVV